jgi:hypothetical protein
MANGNAKCMQLQSASATRKTQPPHHHNHTQPSKQEQEAKQQTKIKKAPPPPAPPTYVYILHLTFIQFLFLPPLFFVVSILKEIVVKIFPPSIYASSVIIASKLHCIAIATQLLYNT